VRVFWDPSSATHATPTKFFFDFTGNTFIYHICADYCQEISQECADSYIISNGGQTHTFRTAGDKNALSWCESQLAPLLPYAGNTALGVDVYIDAHGVDKSLCYSFAPVVNPFVALLLAVLGLWALSF